MDIVFYNLRVGRSNLQVMRELNALARTNPDVIGVCEGVGYALIAIPGYTLVRDRSTASRANVAAYVRSDLRLRRISWIDLAETWGRTQHRGQHPPRSYLSMFVDGVHVIVAHQPPKGTDNTRAAQQEGIDALVKAMAPWVGARRKFWPIARRRTRIVIFDANRTLAEDGPGPAELARRIGGHGISDRIDTAVFRNGVVTNIEYPQSVAGIALRSDHRHALRFRLDR